LHKALSSTLCAATFAAMAITPSWAAAAPGTVGDDTVADFASGTTGTATQVVAPGSLRLARGPVREDFDGAALPAGLTATPWEPGGAATFAGGALSVDGARVAEDTFTPAGRTLEFRATFSAAPFEHVGFGEAFEDGPWAMFSTGGGALPTGLYARTATTDAGSSINVPIAGVDATAAHTYRIEWAASEVGYYIDDKLVLTQPATIAKALRPIASDFAAGGGGVRVDWLVRDLYLASGTFESRVLDAGDARALWGALTPQGGTGVVFATRSGNTATPDASWSRLTPVGPAGEIVSPIGRYLQYTATLSTADSSASPTLERVDADFSVDTVAPATTIGDVQVSGQAAKLTFSSADTDVARFECSLDGGSYAACASPAELTGLAAGAHTLAVRAVDRSGNTGTAVSQQFTVQAPAGPAANTGTGTPAPVASGGVLGATADHIAPIVRLRSASVRASKTGIVKLTVACPGTETSCAVSVRLKRKGVLLARKSITVAGGKSRTLRVRLSLKQRRQLAHDRRMKVTSTLTARDAAGNTKTTNKTITLVAPSR
jgi:hypothetical protein